MRLQELIDQSDLILTEEQVKAFFLGILTAEKPLPFNKAVDELLVEADDVRGSLEPELKKLWDSLSGNKKAELKKLLPADGELIQYMELAKEQLDYFLTAMSLAGTNIETCKDKQMTEHLEELEDIVEDLDEYLTDDQVTEDDGEEFKEYLVEAWDGFVSVVK